jgi:hypothetical protein
MVRLRASPVLSLGVDWTPSNDEIERCAPTTNEDNLSQS